MRWWRRSGPGVPWPVRLAGTTPLGDDVVLRALGKQDIEEYSAVRRADAAWLTPWDATPPRPREGGRSLADLVEHYDREARAGRMLPFAVEVDGRIIGQLNLANVVLESLRSCSAGYWVIRAMAGRGIIPTSLAIAGDHAFAVRGLHRLEVNVRPENSASLAVVRKLGFRDEGTRRLFLHIDGAWRDHLSFALTTEDLAGESFVERLARVAEPTLPRHTGAGPPH